MGKLEQSRPVFDKQPVHVTLVSYQEADFPEIGWLKRLLPGCSVELIEDPAQTTVIPDSMVICKRLGKLRRELLQGIAATPGVVLFHISDEWYWDRLEPYRCFVHVVRTYHYPALRQEGITQIPLGPRQAFNDHPAMRPVAERRYRWCFAGNLASTRRSLAHHLVEVQPGYLHITGTRAQSATWLGPEEYTGILRDSVFAPCPMGNVNLESFRLYEALDCGAIPIVERRPWFDYFSRLFGAHPLPSVCHWREAPGMMASLGSDPVRLQAKQVEIRDWWRRLQVQVSNQVMSVINAAAGRKTRMAFVAGAPSRLGGMGEMLKHHNSTAVLARIRLTTRRLGAFQCWWR